MSDGRNFRGRREGDSALYSPEQVESILTGIGVEVAGETTNDFLCYCPFHGNRFTPSFSVSRTHGSYICFNAACNVNGNLLDLVKQIGKKDEFQARRFIIKARNEKVSPLADRLAEAFSKKPEFPEFSQEVIDRMYADFWLHEAPQQYMMGERHFTEETLRHFKVGYSAKKNLIAVPMHDPKGNPVGVIGRSMVDKRFRNSDKLPTSKTLWNFHRAKRAGETVIITEASYDAMRVHQAGYENVVACLGGNFNANHFELLDKTFTTIVLMTDFDDKAKHMHANCRKCASRGLNLCVGHNPGRDLGSTIAEGLRRKKILWASFEPRMVYPHGAKDAGDLTDDEIRQCLHNAVPNYEYAQWGLY